MASAKLKTNNLSLATLLSDTPFITTALAATLSKGCKLTTLHDLLRHYPRRYEDRRHFRQTADIRHGENVTVLGRILNVDNIPTRTRMVVTKVAIKDDSGIAFLVFFNQWYLKKQIERYIGSQIIAYGKASRAAPGRGLELSDVEWEIFDPEKEPLSVNRIVPVYPLTEGVTQSRMRRTVHAALELADSLLTDYMPQSILERQQLPFLWDAYPWVHFPESEEHLRDAQRRFAFDEYFGIQLLLAVRKREVEQEPGTQFENVAEPVDELLRVLPYKLTDAQLGVIADIQSDMQSPRSMNRLVQGDVGAGKTVVAMASLIIAVRNGYQAAMMAPTEILAEQHYLNIHKLIEQMGIRVILITGSMTAREKAAALASAADGSVDIVVGTHALIQKDIAFANLGLAVVDEQHRFGVLQRGALRQKGTAPDILIMTATPIPRTLTLTVYGDLDVSIIDQLPPGRRPVRTHWKHNEERASVYETIRKLLVEGRQGYVICSLVMESEKLQARAATELALHLQKHVFPEFTIGLLHGQMKPSEKEGVMDKFRSRELHLLVSTTVIEVGVDVPNASIIVIEDADRFGLAQLHQLRGRVGRGATQSYCILISDPKTDDGRARMDVMTSTCDGFRIAEEDLKLRGPGDFYGTRQSGQTLPFVDVLRDVPVLYAAREEAFTLLDIDPKLDFDRHQPLRHSLQERHRILANVFNTN